MSNFKVGDKVRVLRGGSDAHYWCSHSAGDVCTVEGVLYGGHYEVDDQIMHTDDIELIPMPRFKVGETYTSQNGDNYKCINVNEDGSAHLVVDVCTPAYVWDADGRSLSLSSEWDIVFPPVVETKHHAVTVEGNRLTIVYKVIDGVPDTDNAQLVPF